MTNKEIILSAIKLKYTERLPVIILSSGIWTYNRFGLSLQDLFDIPPEVTADYVIENYKHAW